MPDGTPLFATFLDVLERFAAAPGNVLEAYQLGDRYDLGRGLTAEDEGNVMAAYSRIRNAPGVSGLAPRVDGLGGNTDGKIFLTHGLTKLAICRLA